MDAHLSQGSSGRGEPDLSQCAQEPIHIPGAVQPRGVMLVADRQCRVTHAAGLSKELLGHDPDALLGLTLAEIGVPAAVEREDLAAFSDVSRIHNPVIEVTGAGGRRLVGAMHEHAGRLIVELEDTAALSDDPVQPLIAVARLDAMLQQAATETALAEQLARWFSTVSGYDRAMVYRFDREWNGEVIAEEQNGLAARFLGLNFPAADIPPQARALYERNLLRILIDVEDAPLPLVGPADAAGPVDMSHAALRAISPVHVAYLRNMGVRATLVASLLHGDRLWGLLVGHHYAGARHPGLGVRQAVQLGSLVAVRHLARIRDAVAKETEEKLNRAIEAIERACESAVPFVDAVAAAAPLLAEAIGFDGLGVVCGTETRVTGTLAGCRLEHWPTDTAFMTAERFPETVVAELARAGAAGIVGGAVLPLGARDWVLLGRLEQQRSVVWGGDPSKPVSRDTDEPTRLHPRSSFEAWREAVNGRARPLSETERDAALRLAARLGLLAARARERSTQHRLQHMQRLGVLGQVAGGVAHDLNNVLGVIALNLELVAEGPLDGSSAEMVGLSRAAVDQGRQITSSLLAFARHAPMQQKTVSPAAVALRTVEMMRRTIGPGHALVLQAPDGTDDVRVDEALLQTALMNLITNARDAMAAGGTISVSVSAAALNGKPAVSLTVADTGAGMDEATRRRATEPFFTTKDFGKGTGLGLSMVMGFAEQSGGVIDIASVPGQGTTVTITLPGVGHAAEAAPSSPEAAAPRQEGATVLVVEDNTALHPPIRRGLAARGLDCRFATSVAEGRSALAEGRAAAIVTDIQLPGGESGVELARWCRSTRPELPVVLMTGFADSALLDEVASLGLPLLMKPFTMATLCATVRDALGDGRAAAAPHG